MKVKITHLQCLRCGWTWFPRKPKRPGVCPKCKRKDWDSKKLVSGR